MSKKRAPTPDNDRAKPCLPNMEEVINISLKDILNYRANLKIKSLEVEQRVDKASRSIDRGARRSKGRFRLGDDEMNERDYGVLRAELTILEVNQS